MGRPNYNWEKRRKELEKKKKKEEKRRKKLERKTLKTGGELEETPEEGEAE